MSWLSILDSALSLWGVLLFLLGVAMAVKNLLQWWTERHVIQSLASDLFAGEAIAGPEDLLRLKQFLSCAIVSDVARMNDPRPLLRHSAKEILERRFGFCGENARVTILLLLAGGVRANRLYMEGTQWGHVAVEHFWRGKWYLFDAHNDPCTLLPDTAIAAVPAEAIDQFPQRKDENPWQRVYRVKLFHRIRWLRFLEQVRLPQFVVRSFETPALLRTFLGLSVATTGLLLLALH